MQFYLTFVIIVLAKMLRVHTRGNFQQITPIERGRMIGMHEASLPFREITRRLGPTDSTILRTSREWNNEELQMRRRGTDRFRVTQEREDHLLRRSVIQYPW